MEKNQLELCSKYDREDDFDVILGEVVLCRSLRWICRKHSNDVARQVKTTDRSTIFVARQIYLVARHKFHVVLEVTPYHDWKTSICCISFIFSLTTCKKLRQIEPAARSSTQKFDYDCDVTFMFKM